MINPLKMKSWSPYIVGAGIGLLSWFTFASAGHPIGVSTTFEHTAAMTGRAIAPQVEQQNPYFAKKRAEGRPPRIDWQWMLVLGVFAGAWLSARLGKDRTPQSVPPLWRWRFGNSVGKRFAAAFAGGALMMFGARLAGGCTSGHGISGTLQLALSSWIFVAGLFASGALMALLLFGKEGRRHV